MRAVLLSPLRRALLRMLTVMGSECTVVLLKAKLYLKPCDKDDSHCAQTAKNQPLEPHELHGHN